MNEFHEIKKSLFNKKTYNNSPQQEKNQTSFSYIIDFLAGFFNLRDYRDNLNPRSILTKAEKNAYEGDVEQLIYNLNQLPTDWKAPMLPFIEKCKNFISEKEKN